MTTARNAGPLREGKEVFMRRNKRWLVPCVLVLMAGLAAAQTTNNVPAVGTQHGVSAGANTSVQSCDRAHAGNADARTGTDSTHECAGHSTSAGDWQRSSTNADSGCD